MSTPTPISFFVSGLPRPGGSKTAQAYYGRDGKPLMKGGRVLIGTRDAGGKKTENWRAVVAHEGRLAYQGDPLDCALLVEMTFVMPRPKGHYRTGKFSNVLRDDAPTHHTSAPDALKLARSTEDALTGIIWNDDSRTAKLIVEKVYGERPGVRITVAPIAAAAPKAESADRMMSVSDLFEGRVVHA